MRRILVWLILAAACVAQAPQWVRCPLNGHLYALTDIRDWTSAEQLAVSYGGHLATVRSQAENDWLVTTFSSGQECLWLGLNDLAVEGTFVWTSGEPVVYLSWNPGEPNGGGWENVVHLCLPWGSGASLINWNDAPNQASPWGVPSRGIMEVDSLVLADYAVFGAGCSDPFGTVPVLDGVPGERPQVGTTSRVRVSSLPSGPVSVPVFFLGFSNQYDTGPGGAYALPFDLGVLGWPGCDQLVSVNATSYAITITGDADLALAIPPLQVLVGLQFYLQALVLYHPSGVAVSNGVIGTVGY